MGGRGSEGGAFADALTSQVVSICPVPSLCVCSPPTIPPTPNQPHQPHPPPGIYVSDILDAVPIDKYFELFKPGAGGEGGFIRLGLDYSTEAPQISRDGFGRRKGGKG